jgi:hypothetical protein
MDFGHELYEWLEFLKQREEVEMVTNHNLVAGASMDYFEKVLND